VAPASAYLNGICRKYRDQRRRRHPLLRVTFGLRQLNRSTQDDGATRESSVEDTVLYNILSTLFRNPVDYRFNLQT
jgi:hypothetical protein